MRSLMLILALSGCMTQLPDPALRCEAVCEAFNEPSCPSHLGTGCLDGCYDVAEASRGCELELDALLACQESFGCIDMTTECRDERSAFTGCQLEIVR